MALGASGLMQGIALHRSQSVAVARVVEARTMLQRWGRVTHEVRYAFSPTPGDPEIGRSDFLGRTDLWSSLPEAEWRAATAANKVKVRFDPRHPGNNAPDSSLPGSLGDSGIVLGLGIVGGLFAIRVELERRRHSEDDRDTGSALSGTSAV